MKKNSIIAYIYKNLFHTLPPPLTKKIKYYLNPYKILCTYTMFNMKFFQHE